MWKQALLILFLALAPGSDVRGQAADSEIILGGILLRLGMSQNEAFAALGPVYDLRDVNNGANWFVSRRGSSVGDVGNIAFQNRRLVMVSKEWSPRLPTAGQLVEGLYGALASVGGDDFQTCQVYSGGPIGGGPDLADLRIIKINCGGRTIDITGGPNHETSVHESISNW